MESPIPKVRALPDQNYLTFLLRGWVAYVEGTDIRQPCTSDGQYKQLSLIFILMLDYYRCPVFQANC